MLNRLKRLIIPTTVLFVFVVLNFTNGGLAQAADYIKKSSETHHQSFEPYENRIVIPEPKPRGVTVRAKEVMTYEVVVDEQKVASNSVTMEDLELTEVEDKKKINFHQADSYFYAKVKQTQERLQTLYQFRGGARSEPYIMTNGEKFIENVLAGWLLVFLNFGIVLMWKRVRSDTKLLRAIWFCIFLHQVIAFLNAYIGGIVGTEGDARSFHFLGVEAANGYYNGVLYSGLEWFDWNPRTIYTNSLAFLYRTFGASFLLGDALSVLAFTFSCVVLVKLVDLLDLRRFRVWIILLFGMMPSAVITRSVTLRESWQALFFLLCIYWAIRLRKRPDILIFLFLLMSALCMALLHYGLKVYAVYFILIAIYWGIFGRRTGVRWAQHVRFLFAGLLVICLIMLTQKMGWYLTVGDALEAVGKYRQNAATIDVRATYGVVLDNSSVLGLVETIPSVFVHYMLAPFPWQVENISDVSVMLESMLRFALLLFAVYSWRRSSGEVRNHYSFLLIVVLCMELMWALATINWGTAIRHHVPGHSVIVLLGAPGLILFMRKLHFEMFGRKNVGIFQDREKFVKPDPKINEML